ncbi:MAG TPA: DUF2911 domain-containing protein [Ferruginibacter sp.]|nr:DUF2911 domain-containing protein [Ferruginibacter sp.]HRO06978.1 DUF2911 domain-containing protein [Ferruginibacter sp.]HRO95416.1 DUF2911 domain-containing protein [Ferruginibacter sp.]HRP50508.1 DUF2911 domain-containing protein [Ferruginibacter sp.]
MKYILLTVFTCCTLLTTSAQDAIDKSPLDVSYYPAGYPLLKVQDKVSGAPLARIIFSRPQKNGRPIFGNLIEYGKLWRLGANEATEIEFFKNVDILGNTIRKGRYTLYAIPHPDKWTIIINKDTDSWGTFKYSKDKDVARFDVPVQTLETPVEYFNAYFEKNGKTAGLMIMWDNVRVTIPISL